MCHQSLLVQMSVFITSNYREEFMQEGPWLFNHTLNALMVLSFDISFGSKEHLPFVSMCVSTNICNSPASLRRNCTRPVVLIIVLKKSEMCRDI